MPIKYLSINSEILDLNNILTTDIPHIVERKIIDDENWYTKYSDGYIEQCGKVYVKNDTNNYYVNLHVPFKKQYVVMLTNVDVTSGQVSTQHFSYYVDSLSRFNIKSNEKTPGDACAWYAYGF